MRNRWPVRRLIVVAAGGLTIAALAAFLWATGQTDSGLYCSTAYPETAAVVVTKSAWAVVFALSGALVGCGESGCPASRNPLNLARLN